MNGQFCQVFVNDELGWGATKELSIIEESHLVVGRDYVW